MEQTKTAFVYAIHNYVVFVCIEIKCRNFLLIQSAKT